MTELIERLRRNAERHAEQGLDFSAALEREAAAALERLTQERDELAGWHEDVRLAMLREEQGRIAEKNARMKAEAECERLRAQADGWVWVPIEPTYEMLVAARDWSAQVYGKPIGHVAATACHKAMIAAAPPRAQAATAASVHPELTMNESLLKRAAETREEFWGNMKEALQDMPLGARGARVIDPAAAPVSVAQARRDALDTIIGGKHDMRMMAYYYAFSPTGVEMVDRILSAVACAGKAYHGTDCWADNCEPYEAAHRGECPVEWIYYAAEDLAKAIIALRDTATPSVGASSGPNAEAGESLAHTDHPARHFDRTCPACIAEGRTGANDGR